MRLAGYDEEAVNLLVVEVRDVLLEGQVLVAAQAPPDGQPEDLLVDVEGHLAKGEKNSEFNSLDLCCGSGCGADVQRIKWSNCRVGSDPGVTLTFGKY